MANPSALLELEIDSFMVWEKVSPKGRVLKEGLPID